MSGGLLSINSWIVFMIVSDTESSVNLIRTTSKTTIKLFIFLLMFTVNKPLKLL